MRSHIFLLVRTRIFSWDGQLSRLFQLVSGSPPCKEGQEKETKGYLPNDFTWPWLGNGNFVPCSSVYRLTSDVLIRGEKLSPGRSLVAACLKLAPFQSDLIWKYQFFDYLGDFIKIKSSWFHKNNAKKNRNRWPKGNWMDCQVQESRGRERMNNVEASLGQGQLGH